MKFLFLRPGLFFVFVIMAQFIYAPKPGATVNDDLSNAGMYPNPFNGAGPTRVAFTNLPIECTLSIYDKAGSLRRSFDIDGEASIDWDFRDSGGSVVPDNVYRIVFANNTQTKETFLFKNVGSVGGSITTSFVGVAPGSYPINATNGLNVPIGTVTLVVPTPSNPEKSPPKKSWFPGCSRKLTE